MKTFSAFASLVLAVVCILASHSAVAQPFTPTSASQGWGPSWVGGAPPGGFPRPNKFDAAETRTAVFDDESRIGFGVKMWADGQVVKGHEYQLLYQLRVQTKKGEEGPLLTTADQANGATFVVAQGTADDKWNGLEGRVDITRKDLSTMTNLPKGKLVTVRIEPQLYDVTTKKYLTVPKTDAIIAVVDVDERGRVDSVVSLASYILSNAHYDTKLVVDHFADLDAFDAEGNNVGEALGKVLNDKETPAKTKMTLIHLVSKPWVHMKSPELWTAVNALATSDNAELQAAAKELLK